jgi:inosine-uridine nucleoside N-ribohydrolase
MKSIISFLILSLLCLNIYSQKQKIIFDCDLAGDVDDAYALALILSSLDDVELLGIVTDQGLTTDRALVAAKMLDQVGLSSIPISIGRETKRNLFNENSNGKAPYDRQMYWAKDYTGLKKQELSGADFIVETLKKYPNEVILITVGPIPNIGDVLNKDPNVLKLAKQVVSMQGSFYVGYNGAKDPSVEYNVLEDLKSSKMLLKSGADITYIGLDVTDHVKLPDEERLQLFMRQTPLTDAVSALYALWRGEWGPDFVIPTLYDVVAIGYVLWPELFKIKPAHVKITDEGYTKIYENKKANCKIALEINEKEFLNRFMNQLLKQNLGVKK